MTMRVTIFLTGYPFASTSHGGTETRRTSTPNSQSDSCPKSQESGSWSTRQQVGGWELSRLCDSVVRARKMGVR